MVAPNKPFCPCNWFQLLFFANIGDNAFFFPIKKLLKSKFCYFFVCFLFVFFRVMTWHVILFFPVFKIFKHKKNISNWNLNIFFQNHVFIGKLTLKIEIFWLLPTWSAISQGAIFKNCPFQVLDKISQMFTHKIFRIWCIRIFHWRIGNERGRAGR